jgi:fructose/tagatose bisphosphate aldolase
MALVPMPDLLADARAGGYAVGYFEAWDLASLEAVLEAAEAERAPVVLGFGCLLVDRVWLDDRGIEVLGGLGRAVAERARVPTCLLLNEAHTVVQAIRGLDAGFTAVMLHTSGALDESVDDVGSLVAAAHARGAAVEGELGALPEARGGEIVLTGSALTDPDEAAAFVEATGVDCLAVSVGNVHLLRERTADVHLDLLDAIRNRVDVPLVVHGGTGFPPAAVGPAIARGVAKFNVGTVLKQAFLDGVTDAVTHRPGHLGPHDLVGSHGFTDVQGAGKRRVTSVVRELIRLYGSSGHAA